MVVGVDAKYLNATHLCTCRQSFPLFMMFCFLRDHNYGEMGGGQLQKRKILGPKLFAPPSFHLENHPCDPNNTKYN